MRNSWASCLSALTVAVAVACAPDAVPQVATTGGAGGAVSTGATGGGGGTGGNLLSDGEECTEAQQCESGFCSDGTCCNEACTCGACDTGACVHHDAATDPDDECEGVCDGSGHCADGTHIWSNGYANDGAGGTMTPDQSGEAIVFAESGPVVVGNYVPNIDLGGIVLENDAEVSSGFVAQFDGDGTYGWAADFPNVYAQDVEDVANCPDGGVVVLVEFEGTLTLGSEPLKADEDGNRGIAVIKYDANGNVAWSNSLDASQATSRSDPRVAVDPSGDVVVVGSHNAGFTFADQYVVGDGAADIFVVKYDSDGNEKWGHSFGDDVSQVATDVAVDGSGGVVVTGTFTGTIQFDDDGSPISLSAYNPDGDPHPFDMLLFKLDTDGDYVWSQNFSFANNQRGMSVATSNDGDIVMAGCFAGAMSIGSDTPMTDGDSDFLLAAFTSGGGPLWAKGFGDNEDQCSAFSNYSEERPVAVDKWGNIIFAARFGDSVNFGGSDLTAASDDSFVAKFSPAGTHLFSKQFGGQIRAVATDADGNIAVTGAFQANTNFGGDILVNKGAADMFVALFSP